MSAQAEAISCFGMGQELRDFVHTDVEARMTSFLSKEEVVKHGSWGREQALSLATEICDAFDAGNSLLSAVAFTARVVKDLLQVSDLSATNSALERFHKAEQEEILEDGVVQFLQKHKTGMAIISDCQQRVEHGQAQLQGELFVCNLQEALSRVQASEGEMTASAVSDVVVPFWNIKRSKDEQKLTSKHRFSVQGMLKEFWQVVQKGVHTMLSSTLTTCLESLVEAVVARSGSKQPDDVDAHSSLDIEEVFRAMECAELTKHQFWADTAKAAPASLAKDRDKYGSLCGEIAGLARFVFSKKKIGPGRVGDPTSDCLKQWSTCDVALSRYLDDSGDDESCQSAIQAFKQHFVQAAATELQEKAMAAFRAVGAMVQSCVESASSLEEMAASLAD